MKSTSIKAAMARIPPTPSNTGTQAAAAILPRGLPVLLLSEPVLFVVTMGVVVGVSTGVTVSVGVGEGVVCGEGLLVGVAVAVLRVIEMGVCARSAPVAASEAATVAEAMFKFSGT